MRLRSIKTALKPGASSRLRISCPIDGSARLLLLLLIVTGPRARDVAVLDWGDPPGSKRELL